MIRSRLSITRVVLLIFGLTIGLLTLSLYLASDTLIHRLVCDQAVKEARLVSELVLERLYGTMRSGWNEREIEAVVDRAQTLAPGARINLVRNEHVASLFGESEQSRELRNNSVEVAQVLSSAEELVRENLETIEFYYPVIAAADCLACHTNASEGQVNGVVHMTVPLNPLKRPLSDAFASVIQIVAIISVLLLLISFLVNRHFIIRPLTQFTSHVLQVQRAESLASRPRLGDEHLGLLELQVLAQHFDAALDKLACAQERLREQSEIDELTGLLNRRAFNRFIALELSRAKRYARPVAIFVLDLDGFKAINDKHGHAAGDAVLRQCATLLRQSLRQNDLIARIGGDELVIVVPEMEQGAATAFRHKLRRLVTDAGTQHEGLRLQVGASIGVALFPWDGDTPQRLLSRADAMMYEEKRQKQLDC